jgi:hypothetical protein
MELKERFECKLFKTTDEPRYSEIEGTEKIRIKLRFALYRGALYRSSTVLNIKLKALDFYKNKLCLTLINFWLIKKNLMRKHNPLHFYCACKSIQNEVC